MSAESASPRISILMLPGQVPLDLAGPLQVFLSAASHNELTLRFIGPHASIDWFGGLSLSGIAPLPETLEETDLLIVPGHDRKYLDPATHNACLHWLRHNAQNATIIMAVCSGALLLGQAGLLDGHRCTTHHRLRETLRTLAPKALIQDDCIFVEDRRVLTSAGISTGIDTALYWVQRTLGARIAMAVARDMVLYLRRSGQEPQLSPWLEGRNHVHERLHRLQDELCSTLAHSWTLEAMSENACMSPRQLTRLFTQHTGFSPHSWLTRLRLAQARQLLLETKRPIERIADDVGLTPRQLRRQWQQHFKASPSALRSTPDSHADPA
ncbi:GlxA family transcriptional regulator [Larsenimonas suaedae]|uniref:Helix-turn-helix domain-containing protein n=1 Tax=Larsenimonas suaedae TaxID=1851019 RepID=A0ABU1H0C5_9GAMM|nr:helix-turn-helix domain-containing protein [Larsenimonas suaedae]MCM2972884.1 helix-turn-helix domain-containing protein [Larsenimonas suaedae]MDR5896983.1 helix-turn-helix domain-containing protein [Larsenimonas suaedae]